jgi:hypothetical protein
MSTTTPVPDEQPVDLAAIGADDLLLDALGRGEAAAAGDPVAELLTEWRADLDSEQPDVDAGFRLAGVLAAEQTAEAAGAEPAGAGPARVRPSRRLALGVAAAAVALAGLSVAANHAGPGSPLWPITKVMYPQQADIRAAERAIALARTAAAAGRPDDARRLLDDAAAHIARVGDPQVAQRLGAEIDAIRSSLPAAVSGGSSTPAGPPPSASPGPAPAPAATPGPSGGAQPGGKPAPSGPPPVLPGLPSIDPPELPLPQLPLPPLPLPTPSLPGLPLLDDGILHG